MYHSPKLGDFNLEGQEGTVKDVSTPWRPPSLIYGEQQCIPISCD